jgi:alanine racemase
VQVAWALKQEGADYFIVATADEAMELRAGGVTDAVLVLGASPYDAAGEYVRHGIRASITDMEMARSLSAAAVKQGKQALVHIKIDTGMGRIGFSPTGRRLRSRVASLPGACARGSSRTSRRPTARI